MATVKFTGEWQKRRAFIDRTIMVAAWKNYMKGKGLSLLIYKRFLHTVRGFCILQTINKNVSIKNQDTIYEKNFFKV